MKSALLISMAALLAGVSIQCSPALESNNARTISPPINNVVPAKTEVDSPEREVAEESKNLMRQFLKRESSVVGVKNLEEATIADGIERRIWVGFGLAYPRLFILKTLNGTANALYVAPTRDDSQLKKKRKGRKSAFDRVHLDAPRSGWGEFDRFLKDQGVGHPITLSLDKKSTADPDEELIVVEGKSGEVYSMVFYPLSTKSEDGQKALEVCRRIEQEFSIRMGCE